MGPTQTPHETPSPFSPPTRLAINRFISMFASAFRALLIYRHDNKALDEIMENLVKRSQEMGLQTPIKIGVSARTLLFEEDPLGFSEVTMHLSGLLHSLGFKEIIFWPPLQGRHLFQLLNILSNKDEPETKLEKLVPLIEDGERKPVALVPMTKNSLPLKLSDELIMKRLAPLTAPKQNGGAGFLEDMAAVSFSTLADLYTWICVRAEILPAPLRVFVRNLTDAARLGYISTTRFFKVFPLPEKIKQSFPEKGWQPPPLAARKNTPLGHAYKKQKKETQKERFDWTTFLVSFSEEDCLARQKIRSEGIHHSALQDLDVAENLIHEGGVNLLLGLRLLLKYLGDDNTMAVQEKALKEGMDVWLKNQDAVTDMRVTTLLSALRQQLTSVSKIALTLFPLRTAPIESEMFRHLSHYLLSLGEAAIPPLISALEAEQDRGVRRKLCHLITLLGKKRGVDFLLKSAGQASAFLLRNILMILGDIGHPQAVNFLSPLAQDPQKIIRTEALRSLTKIGTQEATEILKKTLLQSTDYENNALALDFLLNKQTGDLAPLVIQLAQQNPIPSSWRKTLYTALARLGGREAREFLETVNKKTSFLTLLNAEQREEQKLIKSLLSQMTP